MAFSVQDTNELGTPFPADWMVMTIIRSSIQRSTINNTVRSLVTCRWNEHEVELVPDPTAAPEANTSEGSLVRLAVGSEIQVRGLINVRAHFQGQGSRRHRKPVLAMTLDVTQIRLDGDGGDGSRSPSPRPEGGLGGEERPPRRTPPPPDGGSGSGSKRRHESTEDEPEGGGRGGRPSDPKRPRPWSGEGSSRGGSGSHGSSTSGGLLDSSSSHAQPTPLAFSALVTPGGGGGGGGREGESTPAAEAPPPPLSGLGMSTSTEVVPPSSICPLDLDTDLCMEIHYIDGYGRVLNMDGSTQEQMHTLFTFRQNRASGVAHWLHVLATRQLTEGYENLRVWEELVFPNPDDTSETETQTRTRRRGTLQLVEVNGRVARRQLPEGPSEGWPLNPYHVITLDPQGALANAQYKRDETIGGGNLRYSFEQRFNNEARRVVHVLLIPKGDDTQFEYQVWEELQPPRQRSTTWRQMLGQGQMLNGINREEYMTQLAQCTRGAIPQPTTHP